MDSIPVKEPLPEAIFDPIMDDRVDVLANPYPVLKKMQQDGAVLWSSRGNQWLVLGYNEANGILRSKNFGKKLLENWKPPNALMRGAMISLRRRQGPSMLIQDPPEHTRLRALVSGAFTPNVIHRLEGHIEEIASDLADKMQMRLLAGHEVDLISEFAFLLPVIVIAELLGVPTKDRDKFKKWSSDMILSFTGKMKPMRMAKSFIAMANIRLYFKIAIEEKRHNPQDDLISELVKAQASDAESLSNHELLANLVLLLIAGHETTVNLIGNGAYNLLSHPSELAKLRKNPALMESAIEEILRYDPPVQIVRRLAKEPCELGGKQIKANDVLTVMTAACNRDPRIVQDPDVFKIDRQEIKHLTFGAGIHYCLGAELARTEGRIAFKTLLDRFPNLALVEREHVYKGPFSLRGFKELYVRA